MPVPYALPLRWQREAKRTQMDRGLWVSTRSPFRWTMAGACGETEMPILATSGPHVLLRAIWAGRS